MNATPTQGDVFTVPLLNGKFGAAVLIEAGDEFRFLVLDGFWDSPPSFEDVSALGFMRMLETGPEADRVLKGWFRKPFPKEFMLLGRVSLDANQLPGYLSVSGTMVFGTAEHFAQRLFERWRLRFDREAFMAELERLQIAFEEEQRKRRENRSLRTMLRERPFARWADQWPRAAVNMAHRIVREAAKELIELQAALETQVAMTNVLKRIVDDFNDLYEKTGCVETQEAAEIVDWIEQLASRVGLSNDDERLTGHRTW